MNTRDCRISVLKNKLIHRVFVLIFMVISIYIVSKYLYNYLILQNILLGLFSSMIAWAIVEYLEFCINTYAVYIDERHTFLKGIMGILDELKELMKFKDLTGSHKEKFHQLDSILSGENSQAKEKLEQMWTDSRRLFNDLYNYVVLYPLKSQVYCCSPEYEQIHNYINRCFWFMEGCTCNCSINSQKLYEVLIKKTTLNEPYCIDDLKKEASINNEIVKAYHGMENIELNEEPFDPPDIILREYQYSIIREFSNIHLTPKCTSSEKGMLIFVPYLYIEQKIKAIQSTAWYIEYVFLLWILFPNYFSCFKLYNSKQC